MSGHQLGGCRLERMLSKSEHSDLYRAFSEELQRPVVIKVLSSRFPPSSRIGRRFLRGGRLAMDLEHRHIVRTFSSGAEKGRPYMLLEFVEGHSLDRILEIKRKLPWEIAASVTRQVAKALDAANQKKVVHRKIEPSHIMLSPGGWARVLGFGLARLAEPDDAAITAAGALVGISPYCPPETGDGVIDIRGDLYSLGCVFYHLLVGKPPFEGREPLELLRQHRMEQPWDLRDLVPNLPEGIALIVSRLLAKSLNDRFQDPKELIAVLDAAVSPELLGVKDSRTDKALLSSTMEMLAVREKETVLVCEDQESVLELLRETLRRLGLNVLTTRDGRAALDTIQSRDVKLFLTDLKVPTLWGRNLLQSVALAKRGLPVIITRGGPLALAACQEEAYNVAACLDRPLDLFELRDSVQEVLGERKN